MNAKAIKEMEKMSGDVIVESDSSEVEKVSEVEKDKKFTEKEQTQ